MTDEHLETTSTPDPLGRVPCPRPECSGDLVAVGDPDDGHGDRSYVCAACGELATWRRLAGDAPMPSERDPDYEAPWWMVGGRPPA